MSTENTNYQSFVDSLKLCIEMAREYLDRCIIEGKVDSDNLYYFNNLFALHIDTETGEPRILCSNTNPKDSHESVHSYNIRFIDIDENLFNKSSEDFDKEHIDSSLIELISKMSKEEKIDLYESLTNENSGNIWMEE